MKAWYQRCRRRYARRCRRYCAQPLPAIGLLLLFIPIILWDRLLPFTGCRILGLIATISSGGLILQHRFYTQQMSQHLKAQRQIEQLRQNAIRDLELAMAQREQAQRHLAHKAALLQSFLDASPDLLYYCNEANQFSGCNRAMELLLGKSQQQIIGLTADYLYSDTMAQQEIKSNQQLFQSNRPLTYEQWLTYPDGRQAYFEIRKVPFYDRLKQQRGLLGFGRDMTDHKNAQLSLEQANHNKSHFIATISHELRTPLSGIVGLSRLLRETPLDQPLSQRYLKTIHLSALTLNNIFNDIISLDKLEQHNITLMEQPLSLPDLFEELEDIGRILVEAKGLSFSLQHAQGLPEFLVVDGTRLRQILWNLLSNAIKFTLKGGVRLQIYQDHTLPSLLNIKVIDSGIGIAASEQCKIFSMYYQVKAAPGLNNPTGAGIGLALSQQLAEIMGGSLTVRSQLGDGSCFTLHLPLHPASALSNPPLPRATTPCHLLLVEDMPINIAVAKSIIEKLGHTVEVVTSGAQALETFSPYRYQFLLLDIQLPDMSGFAVAQQLRATYPPEQLPPIVALTANVFTDQHDYLRQGMDVVLNKPLSVEALATCIQQHADNPLPPATAAIPSASPAEMTALILEETLLKEYLAVLGTAGLSDNSARFESIFADYLSELQQRLHTQQAKELQAIAHKIHSACSTLGLKRLQQLAQQIQQSNPSPTWPQIKQWVDELQQQWDHDVQYLNQWLAQQPHAIP